MGIVKLGENQFMKLYNLKRAGYFGMMYPTLNAPDVVIEKNAPSDGAERDTKLLFVKTFVKPDGGRIVHFESITVQRDGMEVSISSHEAEGKAIKREMQNGKILHLNEKLSPGSEWYLTEAPQKAEGPDLVPTSDKISSDGEVNALSSDKQESSAESSTAEAVKGESTDGGSAAERTQSSKEDEVKRKGDERRLSVGSDAQANREVYEAAKSLVELTGVKVHEVSDGAAQGMLGQNVQLSAAKRRALDTLNGGSAQPSNESELRSDDHQDSITRYDYSAKIQQNLEELAIALEERSRSGAIIRDYISTLSKALGLRNNGNHSNYGTFEAKNGTVVRIRISDHNSAVSNFDDAGYENGISIVVTRKPNEGINNNGTAHIVEYYYNGYKLAKAEGHPLAEIARSMQQVLYSGEFRDTTGLAERQEVNGGDVRLLRDDSGRVYGWTHGGEVWLNRDAMNPETPLHEYTHLWDRMVQRENPELWARGVELMKETPLWDEVRNDPRYSDIREDDDAVASEVHSRLTGKRGAEILDGMISDARREGPLSEAETVSLVAKLRKWLREMFDGLKKTLGRWSRRDLRGLSSDDFVNMTLRDLSEGINPNHGDKELVTLHNISESKLRKAIGAGGLANPSMAVVKAGRNRHEGYGSITLVADASMADKRIGRNAGTWAGDAWTPMYPPIEREQSAIDKAAVVSDIISKVPSEMRELIVRGWDSHMSGGNESGLAYWYLAERGEAPEIARRERKYDAELADEVLGLTGDRPVASLSADEAKALRELYIENEMEGDSSKYDEFMVLSEKSAREHLGKPTGLMRMKAEVSLDMIERLGLLPSISRWVNDIRSDVRQGNRVDVYKTSSDANKIIGDRGLTGEFERWIDGLDERFGVEEKLFAGYTASGNRRLLPNTVENASKIMRSQGRNGATGMSTGFINFVASVLKPMTSHGQMRVESDKLEDGHGATEEFDRKWGDVYYDLAIKCQPDAERISDDYGFYRLNEAASKKNPSGSLKSEYGIELSAEDSGRLTDMLDAIRNERPVKYFETKFERPVMLDEFAAAVVPEGMDPALEQALRSAGLRIEKYSPEKSGDRQRVVAMVSNMDGVRFHAGSAMDNGLMREPSEPYGRGGSEVQEPALDKKEVERISDDIDQYEAEPSNEMEARAVELAGKLNTPIKLITSADEIGMLPTSRQRHAKGWITSDGEIVIVVPNNTDIADIENTVVHEIVGHDELEAMIGPERMDEFVMEVYDHAGQGIKKKIDARADKEYSDDIDRMTRQKGGGVFAKAEATARANAKKRDGHYQREATKEYMADMAGEIGDKGFERMSQEEQTLWGKIKAKVQQFLDKFLRGLNIAKSIQLKDKDLAYILYKAWKHKRENGVFAEAEDIAMRRKAGYDRTMFADGGNKKNTARSEAGLNPIYPSSNGGQNVTGREARLNDLDPASNHDTKVIEKLEIATKS